MTSITVMVMTTHVMSTSIMARTPKLVCLVPPLKDFKIPVISWHPSRHEFKEFQQKWCMTYTVPEEITINGKRWYRLGAYGVNDQLVGSFLVPFKYYPLWQRLVYGALLQEKMYAAWITATKL
jgi:hypothetical protein